MIGHIAASCERIGRPPITEKLCSGCNVLKPITEFYCVRKDNRRDKWHSKCNVCRCAQVRANRLLHLDEERAYKRAHRMENRDMYRRSRWIAKGIPEPSTPRPDQCEVCGGLPGKKALAVDHCHKTGKFRGWLCGQCNTALGMCSDTPERLEALAAYLRAHA